MNPLALPMCGKCCRPVERLETAEDLTRGARGIATLRAYCHGAVEEVQLDLHTFDLLVAAAETQVWFGTAFATPELPA